MDKPLKILLYGAICAAIIAAVGFGYKHRLESKVRNLEAECVEEGKQEIGIGPTYVDLRRRVACQRRARFRDVGWYSSSFRC
jgi:hypothetical protein